MAKISDFDHPFEAVEELLKALEAEFPEPVDVYENELAGRLGLVRHPSCPLEEWRRQRVRLIDTAEDDGVVPVRS